MAAQGRQRGIAFRRVTLSVRQPSIFRQLRRCRVRRVHGPALPRSGEVSLAACDDDSAALLALHDDSLWEVLFREGTVRRLCALDTLLGPVVGIAYGP